MLRIEDFTLELPVEGIARPVLDSVNISVSDGEVVGLVGESGSGKSTTAKAAMGSLPAHARPRGSIHVDDESVLDMGADELRRLRTNSAAMIFQDPRTTLNPVRTVGDFLMEQLRQGGCPKDAARTRMIDLLTAVHVSKANMRMNQYPHELSGGMLQRVVIAAALANDPKLILADEPTSALDVSTQAEIMSLLAQLQSDHNFAMLFITHDLQLAAAVSDRVYVMYAGHVVEEQPGPNLFRDPLHPYTRGLLDSAPELNSDRILRAIPGRPLMMSEAVTGCPFAARCQWAEEECRKWRPEPARVGSSVKVACRRHREVAQARPGLMRQGTKESAAPEEGRL